MAKQDRQFTGKGAQRSNERKRRQRRRGAAGAKISRARKHSRDLREVMLSLYNVLTCVGLEMEPFHDKWMWSDAVRPNPDGSQNAIRIFGLAAIVTTAAMLTADTCEWIAGPLGELQRRIETGRFPVDVVPWLKRKKERVLVRLHNIERFQQAQLRFGAVTRPDVVRSAIESVEALVRDPSTDSLSALRSALDAMAPGAIAAGFYKPSAAGPMGQFMVYLREMGFSYEHIAITLGKLGEVTDFRIPGAFEQHREAVLESCKRRINRQKVLLKRWFGDDVTLLDGARNVPGHQRCVVLFSIRVEKHSTATIHL